MGSDLFRPFRKDIVRVDGERIIRQFYLVDVDSFMEPIIVVPDIGSVDTLRYFQVKPRRKWHLDFIDWLETDEKEVLEKMKEEEGTEEYKLEWVKPPPKPKEAKSKKKEPKKKKRKKGAGKASSKNAAK